MNFKKGSPESAGIHPGCLHFWIVYKNIPMHSFLLMRYDTLIAEGYSPYQKDTPHRMFSISKKFYIHCDRSFGSGRKIITG